VLRSHLATLRQYFFWVKRCQPALDRKLGHNSHNRFLKHASILAKDPRSILLIDDDVSLCTLIAEFLSAQEFNVETVHNGPRGLASAIEGSHDLVLLDVMLPVLDGFHVLQRLRQRSMVPVIMLTARNDERDRIAGLDAGADDYIAKPLRPHELLARVRAVLRRTAQRPVTMDSPILIGDVELKPNTREVFVAGSPIETTSFEFDILDVLMRMAGRVVSRDELAAVLYHREATPYERAIDVHISHLRRKLETGGGTLIRTVRGIGYQFITAVEREK
jgi:DNA-binding response OmpR family regulator